MIVMKFGGSSVESGEALAQVVRIVKTRLAQKPVVVVSAMGQTTNLLLKLSAEATRGHAYLAWKELKELQEYHLDEADKVVHGEAAVRLEQSVRRHFRNLHLLMIELSEEGRQLTPMLQDEIVSFGERISSEVVAAALDSNGVPAVHLDSRDVIVTDGRHTCATPLTWLTYARLRRSIPRLANGHVVVMGGFIGATEDGATTTLGRGGSDLTATLVGAGLAADGIEIWKDVDGVLTCDPKLFSGAWRLKSVSYAEAAAMAHSGAKVLHPETVAPAIRQRTPIVVRNSRHPECDGTAIGATTVPCGNAVKSVACLQDLTVMEIRTRSTSEADALAERLTSLCEQQASPAAFRAVASEKLFFAFKDMQRFENLRVELDQCVEVRLRTEAAIVTLVGNDLANIDGIEARVFSALKKTPAVLVPSACSPHAISFIVGQADLRKSVELLHQEFFAVVDPLAFAESLPSVPPPATAIPKSRRNRERIAASPASQPNLAFLRR